LDGAKTLRSETKDTITNAFLSVVDCHIGLLGTRLSLLQEHGMV
jgi:hypothetical protein